MKKLSILLAVIVLGTSLSFAQQTTPAKDKKEDKKEHKHHEHHEHHGGHKHGKKAA